MSSILTNMHSDLDYTKIKKKNNNLKNFKKKISK